MSTRAQSLAVHGLAALAMVCATILGALGVMEPAAVGAILLAALSGIGLYHVPAPSQAGAPMPPPAGGGP